MPNVIHSTLAMKCPKCREGNLFVNKNSYQVKGFFDMPKNCSKCGQDFEIETGFYYGAMYVSYALTIAITVAIFVALVVFNIFSITTFLLADFIVLLFATPYVTRVSRSVWIALMVKYNPNAIQEYEQKIKH